MSDKLALYIVLTDGRTPASALAISLGRFIMPVMLFGPGLLFDSAAMQWAGFVILFPLAVAAMVHALGHKLTLDEAHERLGRMIAARDATK